MVPPDIALLVSTYQRPGHLRRCLASIAAQRDVHGRFEVVVTDDGSTDETADIVREFGDNADFRVAFTTHDHDGFRLARCRNEGVAASTAAYLLFLDGDCVLPPDHVALHLERRRRGFAAAGDSVRLDKAASAGITIAAIAAGGRILEAPPEERRRLARRHRKSLFYQLIRHSKRPKLIGNNIGVWREDFEGINGYCERFVGWGCEDDDLRQRLHRAGVRVSSIIRWTVGYHLWHPTDPTAPVGWRKGANVEYLRRPGRLKRCRHGLNPRPLEQLAIRILGDSAGSATARRLLGDRRFTCTGQPEVELLFAPSREGFSGTAECQVLVALEDDERTRKLARLAHLLVSDHPLPGPREHLTFSLDRLDDMWDAVG